MIKMNTHTPTKTHKFFLFFLFMFFFRSFEMLQDLKVCDTEKNKNKKQELTPSYTRESHVKI